MSEHWFSATQVSTFELCPRKWAWRHIDKLEGKSSEAADFGTRTHGLLESWLKEAKSPSGDSHEEKVARSMIPHLPPPQAVDRQNVEIELSLKFNGIIFVGKIDLYMPEVDPNQQYPIPGIYDHKTTGDPGKWALDTDEMHDDVQATLYASWGFLRHPKAQAVRVQWTYGKTKGAAKAFPVIRDFRAAEIRDRLMRTIQTAKDAQEILDAGITAIDVPYDAGGCEAFGGCPYRDKCNLSAKDKLESIMSQGTESFLTKLRAQKAAQNGAAATPPQAVNPPVAEAPAAGLSLKEKLAAKKAAAQAAPPIPPPIETPAEEPEPKKRGRPAKATATVAAEQTKQDGWIHERDVEQLWRETAAGVLLSLTTIPECVTGSPAENAEIAAQHADALLLEYNNRFPG